MSSDTHTTGFPKNLDTEKVKFILQTTVFMLEFFSAFINPFI